MPIGDNRIYLSECRSTNDTLAVKARKEALTSGYLIVTDRQTHGKGQRGNAWEAPSGKNLTFSFLVNDHFLAVKDHFYLNVFSSLAVADVLSQKFLLKGVKVKWPNDIFVGEQKIGGILIENQVKGFTISQSIVGMGININQTDFSGFNATSLALQGYKNLKPKMVMDDLVDMLNIRYNQLLQHPDILNRDYLERLYLKGVIAHFKDINGVFRGIIQGVGPDGCLLVEDENRLVKRYQMKEIQQLGKV